MNKDNLGVRSGEDKALSPCFSSYPAFSVMMMMMMMKRGSNLTFSLPNGRALRPSLSTHPTHQQPIPLRFLGQINVFSSYSSVLKGTLFIIYIGSVYRYISKGTVFLRMDGAFRTPILCSSSLYAIYANIWLLGIE